jgi:hypothetical protein
MLREVFNDMEKFSKAKLTKFENLLFTASMYEEKTFSDAAKK